MQISLDEEQVQLLAAVKADRVHNDPAFRNPDFEKAESPLSGLRRATQRLRPLIKAKLAELPDESEADPLGLRTYRLTDLGERLLQEALERLAVAEAETAAWGQA